MSTRMEMMAQMVAMGASRGQMNRVATDSKHSKAKMVEEQETRVEVVAEAKAALGVREEVEGSKRFSE